MGFVMSHDCVHTALRRAQNVTAALMLVVGLGGCGGGGIVDPVTPPNAYAASLPIQAASFNPFVGSYAATGRLPDGRAVRYELSVAGFGSFALRYATDAGTGGYTGRFGVATGQIISQDGVVPLPDGTFIIMNTFLPKNNAGSVGVSIAKLSGAATNDYVNFTRTSEAVQGTFAFARVVNPSTDCNAANAPAAFQRLLTKYLIPGAKAGSFYAEGELTEGASSTHGFNFFLNDLYRTDPIEQVSVGQRVTFPNAKAQVNYFERTSDGKIRQWSAVSGALVFDAVEKFGVDMSIGGDVYKSGSAVTFHMDNVRMQAQADNPSDPRFTGARGSFTLSYSGTSTWALQMISR